MPYNSGNQGAIGKQVGNNVVPSFGEFGDQLYTILQPWYYEQTFRGNMFNAFYAAAALAAASATATGAFALWNPAGSGKNLVLTKIKIGVSSFSAAATGTAVALVPVLNQIPSPVGAGNTPRCSLIGSSNLSIANTYVSGTLVGANTVASRIVAMLYADLVASSIPDFPPDEISGSVIIQPNNGITLVGVGGTPTIAASMEWLEVAA